MPIYIVVVVFIVFDVVSGLIKALYHKQLNSTNLRLGLYHKVSEIIAIVGAGLLEGGLKYINFGIDVPALNIVAVYICIMELVSILENLCEVNPGLAKLFKPYLQKLKERNGEDNDNTGH